MGRGQTHRQTDRQTHIRTSRLYDRIGPVGRFDENTIKPTKYKHLSRGNKYACSLLTQIRVGNSFLKSHSFKRGHTENPYCNCNLGHVEDPTHYLIKCNLYNEQRQILVGQMEQFIPNFDVLSDNRKLEILLMGYEYQNPEMTKINTKIMFISQSYILKTKRFSKAS